MSSPKSRGLDNIGKISGLVYDFEKAGDILPKHNHTEETAHITIVARGRLKAYSHDWEVILETGQCADFPAGQPHEFLALEDNTRIYNILKNPMTNTASNQIIDSDTVESPATSQEEPAPLELSLTYL
jgi:quercetin dioxygenase-like cupin family protein